MKLLLTLSAVLCAVALSPAAGEQVEKHDEDVSQLETRILWMCPSGWKRHQGHCFKFIPHPMTWSVAEKNCKAIGGHLASVRNQEEYFWLQQMITAHLHNSPATWLGGYTRGTDAAWFWTDGTSFTFTFWCRGEPNNPRSQQCLQMNYSGNKCWDDLQCNQHRPSVCVLVPSFLG